LIKRLLDKDPRKRLGAEHGAADIKEHPFFKGKVNWALIRNQKPPIKPSLSNSISSSLRDKDSDSSGDENENAGESARTDPFSSFETRTYSPISSRFIILMASAYRLKKRRLNGASSV